MWARLVVGLVVATTLLPIGGAQAAGVAHFQFGMGGAFAGRLAGSCEALGVDFARGPGVVSLVVGEGRFELIETWVNYTLVGPETGTPARRDDNSSQVVHPVNLAAGALRIEWGPSGRSAILDAGGYDDSAPPFTVRFNASRLDLGWARYGHEVDERMAFFDGAAARSLAMIVGWGRPVRAADGDVQAIGDFAFHLKAANLSGQEVQVSMPPALVRTIRSVPGLAFVTERHTHGLLRIRDAHMSVDPGSATIFCGASNIAVDGQLTAYQAAGTVSAAQRNVSFDRQELTLVGAFLYADRPHGLDPGQPSIAPVTASAEGEFEAVGLDFVAVAGRGRAWFAEPAVYVGAAAAFAILWALAKLAGPLFTRLRSDELLEVDRRRRVHETIVANPGITAGDLARLQSMNLFTTFYHLEVLRRHGRIRAFKVQRAWRYASPTENVRRLQTQLSLSEDPKLRELLGFVGQGTPAKEVVQRLQREWGLSRSGSWKVIGRALRSSLLVRDRHGKEVMLRAAA